MYENLYKWLPGKTWHKILQLIGLTAVVITVLFLVVFPWVDQLQAVNPSVNG
jgi:quinol-cytochrome oxidoreductase complex cytochrome b subunit